MDLRTNVEPVPVLLRPVSGLGAPMSLLTNTVFTNGEKYVGSLAVDHLLQPSNRVSACKIGYDTNFPTINIHSSSYQTQAA